MRHPCILIVGAFANADGYLRELNVRRAEQAIQPLAVEGVTAICPHSMNRFLFGTLNETIWQSLMREFVYRADALLCVTRGDAQFGGTKTECDLAKELGKPVLFTMEQVRCWVREQGGSNDARNV